MSKFLRKDDKVIVIAGNDKGKVGNVMAVKNDRILVQGINIRKKHVKRKSEDSKSDIVSIEVPIHISNVLPCSQDGKQVKVKVRNGQEGNKELFYIADGKEVVYRTISKAKKK